MEKSWKSHVKLQVEICTNPVLIKTFCIDGSLFSHKWIKIDAPSKSKHHFTEQIKRLEGSNLSERLMVSAKAIYLYDCGFSLLCAAFWRLCDGKVFYTNEDRLHYCRKILQCSICNIFFNLIQNNLIIPTLLVMLFCYVSEVKEHVAVNFISLIELTGSASKSELLSLYCPAPESNSIL